MTQQNHHQLGSNDIQILNATTTTTMGSIEPSQYITLLNHSNVLQIQNQQQEQQIHHNLSNLNQAGAPTSTSTLTSLLQNFTSNPTVNQGVNNNNNNSNNNVITNLVSNDFDFLSECANSINLDKK
jgi:hypothetical protein